MTIAKHGANSQQIPGASDRVKKPIGRLGSMMWRDSPAISRFPLLSVRRIRLDNYVATGRPVLVSLVGTCQNHRSRPDCKHLIDYKFIKRRVSDQSGQIKQYRGDVA